MNNFLANNSSWEFFVFEYSAVLFLPNLVYQDYKGKLENVGADFLALDLENLL